MVEFARKLLMGLAFAGMLGCPGPKPPEDPCKNVTCSTGMHCEQGVCVKDPKVAKYQELLVTPGPEGTLTRGSQPFNMFGFIPCWDPTEQNHQGWPIIDNAGMDYALSYGANAFMFRLGPFMNDPNPPMNLFPGGPYIGNDPAQGFDEAWWSAVEAQVLRAAQYGANVQIDLIDGWACKHAAWGDFQMPWPPADIEACTNAMTPTQEAFIRKAVSQFGCYGNVFWEDGNEVGVSGRYRPQWSEALAAIVRDEEQKNGCGLRHMLGTNSGFEEVECSTSFDYSVTHSETGIGGPQCGKPRMNNEHNPDPLFTPDQEKDLYCSAQASGQTWWFWRGGQTQENMDKILGLWRDGCSGYNPGECPFTTPDTTWIKVKPHGVDYYDATPLIQDRAYCKSIGFPGQENCPVRPEGDPFREQCEQASMGGEILWWLTEVEGDIAIKVQHRGYQFQVTGSGSAKVNCAVPKDPRTDVCKNGQGGELRISR